MKYFHWRGDGPPLNSKHNKPRKKNTTLGERNLSSNSCSVEGVVKTFKEIDVEEEKIVESEEPLPEMSTNISTDDAFKEIDVEEKIVESEEPLPEMNAHISTERKDDDDDDDDDDDVSTPQPVDTDTMNTLHDKVKDSVYIPPPQQCQDDRPNKRTKPTCALGVRVKYRATNHDDTWIKGMIVSLSVDKLGTKYCDVLLDSGSCFRLEQSKLYLSN